MIPLHAHRAFASALSATSGANLRVRVRRLLSKVLAAAACAVLCASAHADDSLYIALGGNDKIREFTRELVELVTTDPRIQHFFKETDLQRLELVLAEQFCTLAGGPCKYGGKPMREAHREMVIGNRDFNALAEDLQIAMEHAGVPNRAQNRLIALLAPMQRDMVRQ